MIWKLPFFKIKTISKHPLQLSSKAATKKFEETLKKLFEKIDYLLQLPSEIIKKEKKDKNLECDLKNTKYSSNWNKSQIISCNFFQKQLREKTKKNLEIDLKMNIL